MAEFFDTHQPISREVKTRLRIDHQRHGANDLATEARRRPPKFQFQPVLSRMVQKLDSARRKGQDQILSMIGCRDASGFGSIFISGRFDCRLDEPAATPSHRLLG